MSYCRGWTQGDRVLYSFVGDLLIPLVRFALISELSTLALCYYSWIILTYVLLNAYHWSENSHTGAIQ